MSLSTNRLCLFGAIELIHHGQPIDLKRARLDELVAYLAIRPGEACLRSQIAYALWTDSSEKQARTNLRNLIFNLKKNWPSLSSAISIERAVLRWRSDADVTVNITRFEQLLDQAEKTAAAQERTAILAEAASLYRGDLLTHCYEDWAMAARQRLREQYGQAVEQLIDCLFDLRRYDDALDWAKRLLAHDPLQDSVHRRLMQCYMALGDRSAALRTYHDCADMLQTELGVEPSAATLQLVEQLLGQNMQLAKSVEQPPPSTPRPRLVGRRSSR